MRRGEGGTRGNHPDPDRFRRGRCDPVGIELIESYAHPGGNITGVTDLDIEY